MVASPYPYLIFYRAAEDEIVRHGARRSSSMPERPQALAATDDFAFVGESAVASRFQKS